MACRPHLTVLALTASIVTASTAVDANPGILHKHAHRSISAMATLPGQSTGAGAASSNNVSAAGTASGAGMPGSSVSSVAVVTTDPGAAAGSSPGAVGGSGAVCVMVVPTDGASFEPGMSVGGAATIAMPVLPVMDGVPIDAVPIDGGVATMGQGTGLDTPLGFSHRWSHGRDGGGMQPMASGMMLSSKAGGVVTAGGGTTDIANVSVRAGAGGFPARASGVRGDTISEARFHRHGPATMTGNTSTASSAAQAGSTQSPSAHVSRAGAGAPAVGAAGGTAPRWRDRLRVAWPGSK